MKMIIQHLLYYRKNDRPAVGIRVKAFRNECYNLDVGVIIPIPQWYSDLLIYFTKNRKEK
jgi:hypothetical protein